MSRRMLRSFVGDAPFFETCRDGAALPDLQPMVAQAPDRPAGRGRYPTSPSYASAFSVATYGRFRYFSAKSSPYPTTNTGGISNPL